MTKNEFIATIIVMKFETINIHRYILGTTTVTLYSESALTTIDGISNYHKSYKHAIKRLSENTDEI